MPMPMMHDRQCMTVQGSLVDKPNEPKRTYYQIYLDLDPMTLILKLDLDIVKMFHHTKNEVSMSRHSEVIARTDRHTYIRKTYTFSHTRTVISYSIILHKPSMNSNP